MSDYLLPYKRRKFSEESIHRSLDQIKILYDQTNPQKGVQSERSKHYLALETIREAYYLYEKMAGWAESHLYGALFKYEELGKPQDFNWDSHEHEKYFFESDDETPESQNFLRQYFSSILHVRIRENSDAFGWLSLAYALQALNEGEIQSLLNREKTGTAGNSFTLDFLRFQAVLHTYVRRGKGLNADKARQVVASELGISVDCLNSWEKKIAKKNDPDRKYRNLIQAAAERGDECIGDFWEIVQEEKSGMQEEERKKNKRTNKKKNKIILDNKNCEFVSDEAMNEASLRLFGGSELYKLLENFPLERLKKTLLDARKKPGTVNIQWYNYRFRGVIIGDE